MIGDGLAVEPSQPCVVGVSILGLDFGGEDVGRGEVEALHIAFVGEAEDAPEWQGRGHMDRHEGVEIVPKETKGQGGIRDDGVGEEKGLQAALIDGEEETLGREGT